MLRTCLRWVGMNFRCSAIPLSIFVLNWSLMMVSLSFQVTYVSYPAMGMPILLFAMSLGSFLFGYFVTRTLLRRWPTSSGALSYTA